MTPTLIYQDDFAEVWCGDCLDPECVQTVMGNRFAVASILDAPYSERTHKGHADGKATCDRARAWEKKQANALTQGKKRVRERNSNRQNVAAIRRYARREMRRDIEYPSWGPPEVSGFFARWGSRCGWVVSITDHVLFLQWDRWAKKTDRVVFAPLPLVETGSRVRVVGDGPSSWTCWCAVSRPVGEPWSKWGALRGAYVVPVERRFNAAKTDIERIMGGKPLAAMLRIVEDYSNRGDLIVDQTCGAGTTLVAAKMLGRRSVGIERDQATAEMAARNLRKTRCQLALELSDPIGEQGALFG